jgi:hypothetical protein
MRPIADILWTLAHADIAAFTTALVAVVVLAFGTYRATGQAASRQITQPSDLPGLLPQTRALGASAVLAIALHRNPSRLVLAEQLGGRSSARLILEIKPLIGCILSGGQNSKAVGEVSCQRLCLIP